MAAIIRSYTSSFSIVCLVCLDECSSTILSNSAFTIGFELYGVDVCLIVAVCLLTLKHCRSFWFGNCCCVLCERLVPVCLCNRRGWKMASDRLSYSTSDS